MLANIFGVDDWLIVLIVVVVLFGGSQLPKLARNAGEAMKEFRKAHEEATDTAAPSRPQTSVAAAPQPPALPTPAPAQASAPPSSADERVTLSRAELDALLADRERRARAAQSEELQK